MKRKPYSEEKIISILKEHEAGASAADLSRRHGVAEGSIFRFLKTLCRKCSSYAGPIISARNESSGIWTVTMTLESVSPAPPGYSFAMVSVDHPIMSGAARYTRAVARRKYQAITFDRTSKWSV